MLARLRIAIASATLGLLVLAQTHAQETQPTYRFDLAEQPLAEALRAIARQTGTNVLFESKDLNGIKAPALRAELTSNEAINRLLTGTPLRAERTTPTTVVVQPARAPETPVSVAGKKSEPFRLARTETAVADGAAPVEPGPATKNPSESTSQRVDLEEIVVTGSRLRRPVLGGPQQVDIYTREDIQSSGQGTIAAFLNTRKEFGPGIQGEQGFQAFAETSTIQLRALPFGTTLVLINGRRVPSIALNDGQFFNLNNIPAAAVERIEVLPQGSSAVYGSDALAGVSTSFCARTSKGFRSMSSTDTPTGSATRVRRSRGARTATRRRSRLSARTTTAECSQ